MPYVILNIVLFFCLSFTAPAQASVADGLYLKDVTVEKLQEIQNQEGYTDYLYIKDGIIPRIFLENFPVDYPQIKDKNTRNKLFIKILTPLALKVNEEINAERQEVLQMNTQLRQTQELSPVQEKRLEELAVKYDAFTRLKGYRRNQLQLQMLRARIAPVPVSFLIAVSVMETNWGTSRYTHEGNALYKEFSWYGEPGMDPKDENDPTYKVKSFPTLLDSMRSYALKFNSSVSFEHTRYMRSLQSASNLPLNGRDLAHTMLYQSPLKNYVGILDYTITFYKLMILDMAKLAPAA